MSEQQADAQQGDSNVDGNPGVVNVGESLTSFDELEAIETNVKAEARAEAVKEAAIEEAKQELKEDEGGEDAEVEAQAEAEAETETQEVLEEPEIDARVFKALLGEDEQEIRGDMIIPVKVDGEEVEMTLEDIVNGTSGQEAIKKRFGELGAAKKQYLQDKNKWAQEKQIFDQRLNSTVQLLETNPLAGIANLAEMAGKDGEKYLESFVQGLMDQSQKLSNMSEEERRLHEQSVLTENKQARLKQQENALRLQQHNQELLAKVKTFQNQYGIDDETFLETTLEMEGLKSKGRIANEVTPEFVTQVILQDRQEDRIKSVVQVVKPSLLDDRESLKDLVEVLIQQDPEGELEEDDIKDIILQSFPNSGGANEDLSRKVKKSGSVKKAGAKGPAVNPSSEPISFDELDY
jgi:hypothetical protein